MLNKEIIIMRVYLLILGTILALTVLGIFANQDQVKAAQAPAFDNKEDCSTVEGEIAATKKAVTLSCDWIRELGAGNQDDRNSGFGKIFTHRFCQDNYVFVTTYIKGLTAKSHKNEKVLVLHPVKPMLKKVVTPHYDFGNGHKIAEQMNYVGDTHPDGCWIPYLWTKPGTTDRVEKITFVKRCKDKNNSTEYLAAAGIYANFIMLKKLNPADCKDAHKKDNYK